MYRAGRRDGGGGGATTGYGPVGRMAPCAGWLRRVTIGFGAT